MTNETSLSNEIVSSRIFNAPVKDAFRAWSDPCHLKNWWGPAGFTNTFHEFDFRAGGKWHFIMHGPDKGNYNNECEFLIIDELHLISWKRYTKPLFEVMASFEEISADKTKITLRQVFISEVECNKIKAFAGDKNEEVFDRLEMELIKIHQ